MSRRSRAKRAGQGGWRGWGALPSPVVVGVDSGFSPSSLFLGDTGGWYDPSDLSSLFQSSDGTVAVTANNDPVGYMRDKSGNGNHLVQATAGARPLYKTSGGLSWLEFDGTDDTLKAVAFTLNQPLDRISCFRQITWVAGDTLWDGDTTNHCRINMADAGVTPDLKAHAGSEVDVPDEAAEGVDSVLTERWNGASSRFATNNGSYSTVNPNTNNADGYTLATHGSGSTNSNIRFYGSIVIGRTLTDPEIAKCRTFFGAKAGLVL